MNRALTFFLVCLGGSGLLGAAPIQWTSAAGGNDHWYEVIIPPGLSWSTARSNALSAGGYLVTITSAAENTFVTNLISASQVRAWIGANDQAVEGTFRWIDGPEAGSLLTYSNFAPGEPNDFNGEDFLEIFGFNASCCAVGQWNDLPATGANNAYVIEFNTLPSSSVPEPSTAIMIAGALVAAGVARRRSIRS